MIERAQRIAGRVVAVLVAALVVMASAAFVDTQKVDETQKLEQGLEALDNRDYDLAIALFSEVIRRNPEDAETYYNRAQAYAEKGDYEPAIVDYSEAIRLDPADGQAYNSRGAAYSRKGDYDKAVMDHAKAISLDPGNARAYYNRGVAYARQGAYEKAIADYADAVRVDPHDVPAYNNAAWLLATSTRAELRDGKRAVEYATRACELTAWTNWITLGTLAASYAELGQFSEAMNWQNKMLQSPDFPAERLREARENLQLFEQRQPIRDER